MELLVESAAPTCISYCERLDDLLELDLEPDDDAVGAVGAVYTKGGMVRP